MSSVAHENSIARIERGLPSVVITTDQLELVKETIAKGATDAELGLFLYDCRRRGLHPLDRLLHFTKRGGKYTPVTAIDLFRSRAAETGDHVGTDDAIFYGLPGDPGFMATVTVYRMVRGEKCPFTATARMSEYMPEPPNDFMWKKMPYGQLGKCAEALALRKGFPQELDGLHTFEEMEQAGPNDAQRSETRKEPQRKSQPATDVKTEQPSSSTLFVTGLVDTIKRPQGKKYFAIRLKDDGRNFTGWIDKQAQIEQDAKQLADAEKPVKLAYLEVKQGDKTFYNITGISIADAEPQTQQPAGDSITAGDIFPGAREAGQEG